MKRFLVAAILFLGVGVTASADEGLALNLPAAVVSQILAGSLPQVAQAAPTAEAVVNDEWQARVQVLNDRVSQHLAYETLPPIRVW